EMERAYCSANDQVVGVGAAAFHEFLGFRLSILWRIRRLLRLVSSLKPGSYCRSGMSIPWSFLGETDRTVEGDWLSGYGMMWKTQVAREVGFNELFSGYGNGEDLEFSLRMRTQGTVLVAGKARILHLQEPGGRPDTNQMAYTNLRNAYYIHRHCIPDRSW